MNVPKYIYKTILENNLTTFYLDITIFEFSKFKKYIYHVKKNLNIKYSQIRE